MGVSETPDLTRRQSTARQAVAPAYLKSFSSGEVIAIDRWMATKMLQGVGSPPIRLLLWDNSGITLTEHPRATLRVMDRNALWCLLYDPEFYFGELFSTGRVQVEGDLVHFLEVVYRALRKTSRNQLLYQVLFWLRHRPRYNSLTGARQNIHHHYNLSNAFYSLWLDKEVKQYTCAYFPDPLMSLEQAQVAKLHHVCRKLQLKAGDTVVEAGCGWGGLARFMAQHYGVQVRAYNISSEQVAFARQQAKYLGLENQVEYIEDDYRTMTGQYDVFVSVGMLEHVGPQHYPTLGAVIDRCLKPHGRGLIHSIGRNHPGFMNAWIEKRIFPGARPPSLKQMMDIFEPFGFSVIDVENLRLHYAKTLQHWLDRFNAHEPQVREMFDENFVRAWRLYLAGSIAGFTTSELQLFQVVFTRADNNDLPWSRAHLYPRK
ncbi:MAG: class I SAM-dependent methyltransferase [Gammaproteobacteria bacterium]|nr:class I SAM-dependent methyltransferase [Gammaproteobacteria bacterium]